RELSAGCAHGCSASAKPKLRPAAVVYPDAATGIAPTEAFRAARFASLIEDSYAMASIRRAGVTLAVIGGARDRQAPIPKCGGLAAIPGVDDEIRPAAVV